MTKKILIVDDEADLRKLVDFNLKNAGFATVLAANGTDALLLAAQHQPDLVILDLMLPDIQGTEVCRRLKMNPSTQHIPVLILSALGEEIDRVVGFELGADDYVVKPFSVRELVLRVKVILKRSPKSGKREVLRELVFGPIKVDRVKHRVWHQDVELSLTALEFKLLVTLISQRGEVQSRESLLEEVWGMEHEVTTRTVDTHVKRLREKLGDSADYLQTVRGIGYRFAESPRNLRRTSGHT
jgi:two-component system phosphate regulon response regulator PhoB